MTTNNLPVILAMSDEEFEAWLVAKYEEVERSWADVLKALDKGPRSWAELRAEIEAVGYCPPAPIFMTEQDLRDLRSRS